MVGQLDLRSLVAADHNDVARLGCVGEDFLARLHESDG